MTARGFSYEEAARLYREGALVKDIAHELGQKEATIRYALRQLDVPVNPEQRAKGNRRRRVLDEVDVLQIRLYRSQGMSWREIGRLMETNFNTCRDAYQRWQLEQLKEDGNGAA